jgi:signal transduction histidine kinase
MSTILDNLSWSSSSVTTESKHLKAELARMKAEVEQSQAQSRQYLQNVAHQLSAPLGAIKWSIEALKDTSVPIRRKGVLLSSIYSQATILIHLIKNFSLMSNLEHDHELGQFRDQPEPIDVTALAINLSNDFQPQTHEREQTILVDNASFERTFGNNRILMVKNLVAQALSNLLENAVKMPIATQESELQPVGKMGLRFQSRAMAFRSQNMRKISCLFADFGAKWLNRR